ncbi:MAG: tripartite tricarboxylate transporter substrate binding protein [Burkholderiales bacterium]|nr:tripartite tricarboxylate transporter substrate binding protein [Burkholderiales bacterium]
MRLLKQLCALALALAAPLSAVANDADWPSRPVKLIVPFSAGGATDSIARLLAERLSQAWQQPVIVDNKPGAGTILGTDLVAKATPDGYTMGLVVSAHVINPSLRPKLPYDTLRDFAAITQIGAQHMIMAAHPSFEADTIAGLIELAKKRPGKISYATSGTGTALHLSVELLKTRTGIDIVHVPYKGGAPAQQDVVGGQVPILLDIYHSSAPLIKAGKLKAIALLSPKRVPDIPGVPVIAETVPEVSAVSVIGVVAPAAVPRRLIEKASADMSKIIRSADFADRLRQMGVEAVGSTPEQFDSLIRADVAKWAPVVKASGATVD